MKTSKFLGTLALVVALAITFNSCQKEEENTNNDNLIVKDFAIAESIIDDVSDIVDQGYRKGLGGLKSELNDFNRLSPCATITFDTTAIPWVLTIDFGEENCLCADNKWRRGQIITTITGPFFQPGAVRTTTFNEYYVNDNHIEGTRTATNLGPNDDGHPQRQLLVDGTVTLISNGAVITWQVERLRTWIEGYTTPVWYDDVFLITGSGTHSHSNGGGFTRTITEPLRKELSCVHFVSGIVQTVPLNRPTRTLDYGDGTCDNIATLTIGDQTFIIQLP
jgi:hypothetical protein